MSLHCHNCNWGQDDFWNFSFQKHSYNPVVGFIRDIKYYGVPKWKDYHPAEAPLSHRWESLLFIRSKENQRLNVFSWGILLHRLRIWLMRIFIWQEWWTYTNDDSPLHYNWFSRLIGKNFAWKNRDVCPKCGSANLDID